MKSANSSSCRMVLMLLLIVVITPSLFATTPGTVAQTNGTRIAFTEYELFKNTHFQICPGDNAQELVSRSPRGGSRSSRHGSYTVPDNVSSLISTAYFPPSGSYCHLINGTGVSKSSLSKEFD
jgi:hypothetical protein